MKEKIYLQEGEDGTGVSGVLRGPASGPFTSRDFETSLGVPPHPTADEGSWPEWFVERSRVLTALGLDVPPAEALAYVEWLKAEHGFEEMDWEWL